MVMTTSTKIHRSRSRDGTKDPIRRVGSHDAANNDVAMKDLTEPLLMRGESQESSTLVSRSPINASPITVRLSASGMTDLPLAAGTSCTVTTATNNNNKPNNNSLTRLPQQVLSTLRHNPDAASIGVALVAWYLVGVLAICTTKLLLSTPMEQGGVPSPLVLTFQQMFLGSLFLRAFLVVKGKVSGKGLQPWPKESLSEADHGKWTSMVDFLLLAGLFNGLDFLASATSFSHSSASFVETIKASEPITTTALAIWWGIDRLGKMETMALTILISGVLMSTYANATATATTNAASTTTETASLQDSIKTCLTVMTANLCFAFRAMAQKLLRSTPTGNSQALDDFNLLYRMQQVGAVSMLVPVLLFQHYTLLGVLFNRELPVFGYYIGLSLVNAWAFATYCVASCFVLTRISVVQHSGFGCLRRLFAIVATSVAFGVPISGLGFLGILMSVVGFAGFTHFRFQRQGQGKKKNKASGAGVVNKRVSSSKTHHHHHGESLTESSSGSSSEEEV